MPHRLSQILSASAFLLFASFSAIAEDPQGLSDDEIWRRLLNGGIGRCYIHDARNAGHHCEFYLKVKGASWKNRGWPLNPNGCDSTGCVSSTQWGGYTPEMATNDLKKNAVAQARHAFDHPSDPCGIRVSDRLPTQEEACKDVGEISEPALPFIRP